VWVCRPTVESGGAPLTLRAVLALSCRHWGDMQVVRHYFGAAPVKDAVEPLWPAINDLRHGYAAGLRYYPKYKGE